jgi:hypothetical protein
MKARRFVQNGEETTIDFRRCLESLRRSDYSGAYTIEYEGGGDPFRGSINAKKLLEKHVDIII